MHEKSVVEKMGYVQPFDIPFHVSSGSQPRRLNHILTQAVMPDEVRHDLLNVKQNGDEYYMTHRKERYIDKSVPLSSTVSRSNIKTFANTAHVSTVSQKAGNDKESLSQGHKMVDLARVWGYDIHEVSSRVPPVLSMRSYDVYTRNYPNHYICIEPFIYVNGTMA